MTSREFRDRLSRRARRAGVSLRPRLVEDLEIYFQLLSSWNARVNLTGLDLSDPAPEAFDRLLIEPVAAARHVAPRTTRITDIGSGGGSPAIPLALALGAVRLRMVESKTRKSVFLREALRALRMPESEVLTARMEELVTREEYRGQEDLVTVRAVRMDATALETVQLLLRPGGQLFLFGAGSSTTPVCSTELRFVERVTLVESLSSDLTILERHRQRLTTVPRGTSSG